MTNLERTHLGVTQSLIQEFEQHRLPRLLRLKAKMDRGMVIDDVDFYLLCMDINDARLAMHLTINYPELQDFCLQMAHLYKEICDKAMANETR
ncbi:MAG: hypothetical protein RQ982_04690 [Gammaproteobacteria bacterium]|nr:hypothetical protein [Gammaproteobacteria bacterium]